MGAGEGARGDAGLNAEVEFRADLGNAWAMASRTIHWDSAAFWAFAERVSREVEQWPEWQRRAADAVLFTRPAERGAETRDERAARDVHEDAVRR